MLEEKSEKEKIKEVKEAMLAIENCQLSHSPKLREVVKKILYFSETFEINFSAVNCPHLYLRKGGFYSYEVNNPPLYFERLNFETSSWPELLVKGGIDSSKKIFDYISSQIK